MEQSEMPIRELRAEIGRRVDAAHFLGEATVITKNGEPRAAIVPITVLRRYIEDQNRSV